MVLLSLVFIGCCPTRKYKQENTLLKSEIQKSAETNGLDKTFQEMHGNFTSVTQNIDAEISKAKTKILTDVTPKEEPIEEVEDTVGPIKRQK